MRSLYFTLTTWLALLILWSFVSFSHLVPSVLVPSPVEVWNSFLRIGFEQGYKGASLWHHIGISIYRIGVAFLLALVTAIPLGLLCGYYRPIRAVISPLVYFYRPLPPLAYYTLLIIWFGIGDLSKVGLLYLAGFAPVFISTLSAVENVDPNRQTVAKMYGASTMQLFRYVVFPSCLPEIYSGMRNAFGFIYTTLVAAEMVAAASGVGWMVLDASKYLQSDVIFVGIFAIGITGTLLDLIFLALERLLIPWKGKGT
jgi:taurine transport system permease protein